MTKKFDFKVYVFFLLIGLFSNSAQALLYFEDAAFPELVTSGRALAMGNAFISKVDDSASSFYNPAGLGSTRISHFHLFNVHMETNRGLVQTSSGGSAADIGANVTKGFSLEGSRQLLLKHKGTLLHNRLNSMPNIITRYLSMGYMYSQQTRSTIGTEANAKFEFADRRDHGPYWAMTISLFGGVIKIGGMGVYLDRRELINDVTADVPLELESTDYYKGKAFIVDAGARLTLPIAFLPTLSAVQHNATGAKFKGRGRGAPDPIKQDLDVGFSLTPQLGKYVRIHLEANYKDITGQHKEVGAARKLLAGMEIDFVRSFFIRFGYGDSYGSAGLGIKSRRLEFDLTTYAVDTTSNEFRGKEDRRYSMSISSGF